MKSGYMTMTVQLDSHTLVELTGSNARLYYAYPIGKAYDGPISGLPEGVLMELEEIGAIKPH